MATWWSSNYFNCFNFSELSTFLPIAGGTTRFAQLSQGTTTGFIISWVSWLSCVTMPPIEVQAVLQYASTYPTFSKLITLSHGTPVLSHLGLIFATLIMFALCILNIASFKGFVRFNFAIFSFKVLVIILTIIFLMKARFVASNFAFNSGGLTSGHWQAILSAVASGGIAFAFTGFKHGVELAGETKNTQFPFWQLLVPSSFVYYYILVYKSLLSVL